MKRTVFSYLLLAGLMGCGSSNDLNSLTGSSGQAEVVSVRGRTLTVQQVGLDGLVRDGDRPDTLDVEGFDASGRRIFGPVRVPLQEVMKLEEVPVEVADLEFDYLRNNGTMLFQADTLIDAKTERVMPQARVIEMNGTRFAVKARGEGYVLTRELTGDAPSPEADMSAQPMVIKGVCYSPSPINSSNKTGPSVGDLFWDAFDVSGGGKVWNWAALWKTFWDRNIGNSRGDLQRIRDLGANTIRLYSCISYQMNEDGTLPDLSSPSTHRFTHKDFLDACYNDNQKPLNVIVDIPMPDICFRYYLKEALDQLPQDRERVKAERARQVAWWEANLRATVEDLGQHPAVIGFNIMNEQDGAEWSHPGVGQGPDSEDTRYFYAQSVKYAGIVKGIAKDKLCGWAFHDSPDLVIFGQKFPEQGPKYLEQLHDFDYWGVNTYQTQDFNALIGSGYRGSYADLPASMKKPVLLTELGWPATGHSGDGLIDTPETQRKTADKIRDMYPKVFQEKIFLGACYFEFCDEWWKQPGGTDSAWDAGKANQDFPNGFWDEEGFGLFSVSRQGGRPTNDNPWDKEANGPRNPYDKITPRQPLIEELKKAFQSAP